MNRAKRRAAMRLSIKTAPVNQTVLSQAPVDQTAVEPTAPSYTKAELSAARLAANRANAQLSTGPTSEEGRKIVSTNAVRTALTGRTVLLPFDDAAAYEALLLSYQKEFQPVGPIETGLVQSLVDTCWRLDRIPGLEYALLKLGRDSLKNEALSADPATLELHIRELYEKRFRNFQLQENRLVRRRERELKELRALQQVRQAKETAELNRAAQALLLAQHQNQPLDLPALGFEFSTRQINAHLARLTPAVKQSLLKEALAAAAPPVQTVSTAA